MAGNAFRIIDGQGDFLFCSFPFKGSRRDVLARYASRYRAVITVSAALVEWIGSAAACATTISFVPQVWLTWKTRRADGVSLGMYALFTAGVALWLVYGVLLGAWPIIAANAITLVLACAIVAMKLVYC